MLAVDSWVAQCFFWFSFDQELTHHVGSSEDVSHVGVARLIWEITRCSAFEKKTLRWWFVISGRVQDMLLSGMLNTTVYRHIDQLYWLVKESVEQSERRKGKTSGNTEMAIIFLLSWILNSSDHAQIFEQTKTERARNIHTWTHTNRLKT